MEIETRNIIWLEVGGELRLCRVREVIMDMFVRLQPSRAPVQPIDRACRYYWHFHDKELWLRSEEIKKTRKIELARKVVEFGAFELI